MKKQILILTAGILLLVLIGGVQAGLIGDIFDKIFGDNKIQDGKLSLSTDVSTALKQKGITDANVETYETGDDYIIKLNGEDVATIPKQVRDYCIKLDIVKRISKYKVIHERPCSGVWKYRDITDDEVYLLTQKVVESKLIIKAGLKEESPAQTKSTKFSDVSVKI